ncbi:Spermatogenesis-associated protein 22 [Taenia solium]|eukprot:TsM_000308500 transcript=TsM_000308500 gene=TsM_000308500
MSSLSNASTRRNPFLSSIRSRHQEKGVKIALNKDHKFASQSAPYLSNPCGESTKPKGFEKPSSGLRVFSVPVRRVRGLTAALNKLDPCPFIFETVGRIVECEASSDSCVLTFRLEDQSERPHAVQLNCRFEDVDEICPEIFNGRIYRCVGKFSMPRSIFQCYCITPCNDVDLQLLEVFQMHSDNVITQLLSHK